MTTRWWSEEAGFFGDFYVDGDASLDGHLSAQRQSLAERTQSEVDGVMRLLNLLPGSTVLDVPCGYGRHAIELALRGCRVLGVDLNSTHIREAVLCSARQNSCAQFLEADMLTLNLPGDFDAVINMFFSFGFFDTDKENMQTLRNFRRAVRPGGKFLMHTDVNVPRVVSGKYKTGETRALASGGSLHINESYDASSKRITGLWTIEHHGHRTSKAYSVRVYEVEEFQSMCVASGFDSCSAYGNWSGQPYDPQDSEEIIFVAT